MSYSYVAFNRLFNYVNALIHVLADAAYLDFFSSIFSYGTCMHVNTQPMTPKRTEDVDFVVGKFPKQETTGSRPVRHRAASSFTVGRLFAKTRGLFVTIVYYVGPLPHRPIVTMLMPMHIYLELFTLVIRL